ncbi:MAG: hypothetical protein R3C52_09420 [Hyphomonadaceae bacterium]
MKRAVAEVRFPAFEIVFDRVVTFRTGQVRAPIVAIDSNDAIEAMALRLAIRAALEAKGIRLPVRSSFAPHMTLCWGESDQPEFPIAPISWPVHEMCLVESWVGAGRHLALATWPLGRSTSRAHV